MGREGCHWQVTGSLSRHNSAQDAEDNAAWDRLIRELVAVCRRPEFERVVMDFWGDDE